MNTRILFDSVRRWGLKGGLSVLDQGIYSSANFVSMVLLARWQHPQDYGAFSVVFASFLFLSGIYTGMVLEPLSILGPSRFALQKDAFFAKQFLIHFLITIPLAGFMYICSYLIRDELLQQAFRATSPALPLILLPWLARRMYYSDHHPMGALVSSLLYSLSLLSGLYFIWKSNNVSVSTFFLSMALAGVISAFPIIIRVANRIKKPVSSSATMSEVVKLQWDLGKWIVFGTFFLLITELIPVLFVTSLNGLEGAGVFRAIQNLIQPIVQVETALSLAGLPVLAREFASNNKPSFRRAGLVLTASMTGLAIVYVASLWLVNDELEDLLYNGYYAAYTGLIPLYGLVPILIGLFSGYSLSLRVLQIKHVYLLSGLIPFLFGVPVCYYLTQQYGVPGAIISVVFIQLLILVVNFYFYQRFISREQ